MKCIRYHVPINSPYTLGKIVISVKMYTVYQDGPKMYGKIKLFKFKPPDI